MLLRAALTVARYVGMASVVYGAVRSGVLEGKPPSAGRFMQAAASFAKASVVYGAQGAAVLYVGAVVLAFVFQKKLIFFPSTQASAGPCASRFLPACASHAYELPTPPHAGLPHGGRAA